MHDIALSVTQHLYLNVAWILDITLAVQAAITKVTLAFAAAAFDFLFQQRKVTHDAHALAAAARAGLDQQWRADLA